MKKLLSFFIGVSVGVLSAGAGYAETVTSPIKYNPSRLGVFSYLKVKDIFNAPKGITATTMNIRATEMKVLQGSGHKLVIPTINSNGAGTIDFAPTVLTGSSNTYSGYTIGSVPTSVSGNVTSKGGAIFVEDDSYIGWLSNTDHVRVYTSNLTVNKVVVEGGNTQQLLTDKIGEEGVSSPQLLLEPFSIEQPSLYNGNKREYEWVDMIFKDNKVAKVLTLNSGEPPCTDKPCSEVKGAGWYGTAYGSYAGSECSYSTNACYQPVWKRAGGSDWGANSEDCLFNRINGGSCYDLRLPAKQGLFQLKVAKCPTLVGYQEWGSGVYGGNSYTATAWYFTSCIRDSLEWNGQYFVNNNPNAHQAEWCQWLVDLFKGEKGRDAILLTTVGNPSAYEGQICEKEGQWGIQSMPLNQDGGSSFGYGESYMSSINGGWTDSWFGCVAWKCERN